MGICGTCPIGNSRHHHRRSLHLLRLILFGGLVALDTLWPLSLPREEGVLPLEVEDVDSASVLASLVVDAAAMVTADTGLGPSVLAASSHAHRTGRSRFAMAAGIQNSTLHCSSSIADKCGISMEHDSSLSLLPQHDKGSSSLWNDDFQGCV